MNTQKFITLENQTIKIFFSKLKKKYIYVGEILVSFETSDKIVKFFSKE